jgi:hypothetical protein
MSFIDNSYYTFTSENPGVSLRSNRSTATGFIVKSLTAGTGIVLIDTGRNITINATGSGGPVTSVNNTTNAQIQLVVNGGTSAPTVKGLAPSVLTTGAITYSGDADNVTIDVRGDNSLYTPMRVLSTPGGADPGWVNIFYTGDGSVIDHINGPSGSVKSFNAIDPIFIETANSGSTLQIRTTLTSVKSSRGPGISALSVKSEIKNDIPVPYTEVKTLLCNGQGINVTDNDTYVQFSNSISSSGGNYSLVDTRAGYSKIKGLTSSSFNITDNKDSLNLEYLLQSIGPYTSLTKDGKLKTIRFGGTLRAEEYDDHILITNS